MKQSNVNWSKVLSEIKNFIISLDFSSTKQAEVSYPDIFFMSDKVTIFLYKDEATRYLELLSSLISSVNTEIITVRTIEANLQRAIVKSLDFRDLDSDKNIKSRTDRILSELKAELTAPPKEFVVLYPIEGLFLDQEEFTFGNVTFKNFDMLDRSEFLSLSPSDISVELIQSGSKSLLGKVVGIINIKALDSEAAKNLAIAELDRTISALNFYVDFIPYSNRSFLYLPGERASVLVNSWIKGFDSSSTSITYDRLGPIGNIPSGKFMELGTIRDLGLLKVSGFLRSCNDSLFERMLLSIVIAGRSESISNKEEAFLLSAIALESLVLVEAITEELKYRLAQRVALILGKGLEGRKKINKIVKSLYDSRSKIVHTGAQVTDAELYQIRSITKNTIVKLLIDPVFMDMKNINDLKDWFENEIFK